MVAVAIGAGCDGRLDPVVGTALAPGGPALAEPVEPDVVDGADVVLTVRSDDLLVPISPLIYGLNGNATFASPYDTLARSAGQRWSAYNWENNASNAGDDYEYQNDGLLSESDVPGAAVVDLLTAAEAAQTAALVSIAILDDVAADKEPSGDVRDSGANWLADRFAKNYPTNPAGATATPDPTDDAVYQDDFVQWARAGFEGTDVLFTLDSTPDLWRRFHEPLHPEPVQYEELVDRTVRFASAVKAVWPEAPVVGLASYGWTGWETLTDPLTSDLPADAAGKGAFLDYWLAALREAERTAGRRLVDYVDLHWHPEASGDGTRILSEVSSEAVVEARLQAPRSLWDPTYVEESWITEVAIPGEAIRWIPRMLGRIEASYPGTKLAVGEWGFGGGGDISGALATADALGAFGRYGVALAAHTGNPEPFTVAAFAAFRNYDGAGARFGDTALTAVTDDQARTSVYASLDWTNQSRVVVIAINKSTTALTTGLRLAHPSRFTRADTWTLDATGPELRVGPELRAIATNAFRVELPPRALLVIVPTAG